MLAEVPSFPDPWRFQANVEVYVLVVALIGAWVYMVRVVGPRAVPAGVEPVTRRQVWAFVAAMVLLFVSSTWPMHQIGEDYLYSVHMVQHMSITYFMPPLILLATPEWLLRLLVGNGRGYRVFKWLCRPVVAAFAFNGMVIISHIPGVVNASVRNGPLHYSLHFIMVLTALWMWMPVCGPFKELHISPAAKMLYLFAQGIIPTVPAGWLTFADGVVYRQYLQPVRVWGLSVQEDQELAGFIMKVCGGVFMWCIVLGIFIRHVVKGQSDDDSYRRGGRMDDSEIIGNDNFPLTYEQVTEAFAASDRWGTRTVTPSETTTPQPPEH